MAFLPPTISQFQAQFPRDFRYGPGLDSVTTNDIQAAINEGQGLFNPNLWSDDIANFATVISGDVTSGSTTVANLSNVDGLAAGQTITGSGSEIPAGTSIDFVGLNSLIMSAAATQTITQDTLTIGGPSGYTVSESQIAYLYLTAHLLVMSLQAAGGTGAPASAKGQYSSGGGIIQSKSVGGVTVNYAFPDYVINSPTLSLYLRTGYGQKYLTMLLPKMAGRRVFVVGGEPFVPSDVPNPFLPVP